VLSAEIQRTIMRTRPFRTLCKRGDFRPRSTRVPSSGRGFVRLRRPPDPPTFLAHAWDPEKNAHLAEGKRSRSNRALRKGRMAMALFVSVEGAGVALEQAGSVLGSSFHNDFISDHSSANGSTPLRGIKLLPADSREHNSQWPPSL